MEQRKKPVVEYSDNNDLAMILELVSDEGFIQAVETLWQAPRGDKEISDDELCKLADAFADLSEKYGVPMDTMQTAIEMVKTAQDDDEAREAQEKLECAVNERATVAQEEFLQ